jgi:hypothetical protein
MSVDAHSSTQLMFCFELRLIYQCGGIEETAKDRPEVTAR